MRSLEEALKLHTRAIKSGHRPTTTATNRLINLYSRHGLAAEAHKVFDEMPERNVFTWNTIIHSCVKSLDFSNARRLFDSCPCRDTVTYNSIISGYARADGCEAEAIGLFVRMQLEGGDEAWADEFTLTTMLNLSAKLRMLLLGRQLHSLMVKGGNNLSGFAASSLVDMYSKCGSFRDAHGVVAGGLVDTVVRNALIAACCREGAVGMARDVFWKSLEMNDQVSWNTMIAGCVWNGRDEEAVELFARMGAEGFEWDKRAYAGLLMACGSLKQLRLGKEVHARVLKEGMSSNPFVSTSVVDVYSKCGNMRSAENAHMMAKNDNVYALTSMIVGYSAKGDISEARRLFDSLTEKNFVVWTAIISGYVKLQKCEAAFALFREYVADKSSVPDAVILVSLLCMCAIQASMDPGKQIHAYMLRMGITMKEKAVSVLIDMYSKCGLISYAWRIFHSSSIRDPVIYNVMIAGCAHHGHETEAICLFEEMVLQRIKPDAVTFIALLTACRHCGLVEKGESYFLSMTRDYAILPETDHYACMVDLYGRSNQLDKAFAFMEKMPVEPDPIMLSAFLNACRVNKNVELARMAESKLLEIESDNGGRYVQLAGIYASSGKWDEMGRIMRTMRGKEVKKHAGCSWVQVGLGMHTFISGDRSHSEADAIYSTLENLTGELYGSVDPMVTLP